MMSPGAPGGNGVGGARAHREGVLGVQPQVGIPRQHPVDRAAGERGELVQSGCEQARVAAELVDDEARDQPLIGRLEQRDRPEQRREDAAAIDVAHYHDRHVGVACQTHVT